MFRRFSVVSLLLTASMSIGMSHASAATDFRAHWTLDEVDSPTAFDSSGKRRDLAEPESRLLRLLVGRDAEYGVATATVGRDE